VKIGSLQQVTKASLHRPVYLTENFTCLNLLFWADPKRARNPIHTGPCGTDIDAVTEVIKSGRWGGSPYPGPKTAELARKFGEMQGGGYAVPMANGTMTMEVALRPAEIGWGDEVIVSAYTFQATASTPMAAGAAGGAKCLPGMF
jgi:hypothetical protein